jgi:hypothetical protein
MSVVRTYTAQQVVLEVEGEIIAGLLNSTERLDINGTRELSDSRDYPREVSKQVEHFQTVDSP